MALPNAIVTITGDVINVKADANPNARALLSGEIVNPAGNVTTGVGLSPATMIGSGQNFTPSRMNGNWKARIVERQPNQFIIARGPDTTFQFPVALAVPGAPTGCNAVPAFVTPGDSSNNVKCLVSWLAPTTGGAPTSYSVFRNGSLIASGVAGLGYVDTAVANNTAYDYTVVAVNAAGSSGASNPGKAKTPTVAPSALVAVLGVGSLVVSWTGPAGWVSFNLSRSVGSPSSFAVLAAGLGSTGYNDAAVTEGTTYYYRVTSLNTQAGYNTIESKPSNIGSALYLTVPGAPTGCNAVPAFVTPDDSSNNVKCLVSWIAPTTGGAVDSYTVLRNGVAIASGVAGTGYVDLAVANNTTYDYTVVAVNAAGSSGASNPGKAKTPTVAPSGLVIECAGAVFSLAWTAPAGAVAYNIYRALGSLTTFALIVAASGSATYSDSGGAANTIYYYRVTALNTQSGYNTIESKVSNAAAAAWLTAPTVLAHWGLERNDNTKPKSRHLRVIDISAATVNAGVGYSNPIGIAGTVCPAVGVPASPIGSAAMPAAPGALVCRITERPLTPEAGRADYFTMTAGPLFAYFQITIGSPVGLAANVITSACAPFTIPIYRTGRRTYYDAGSETLVNERSPTRAARGTIWLKLRNTRRDWRTLAGKLYRDLPKRRGHS
jgi:fibronectin type 3 domain-containing protein